MAQCTVFGWMLYGNVPVSVAYTKRFVSHQLLCMNVLDQSFKAFWELESVGIPAYEESVSCDPTLLKFQEEIKMVDDRYEVALPWKQGFRDKLLNNEKLALSRLSHLSKKLERDPVLKTRYNSAIKDMWDNGIIEEVPREESVGCGPVFYMPHRPVIRESSVSTKVRPVFDASAKGFNGLSLNDCMEVGPCLLSNLTEILLRFRRWQIAITSDIEKAFLQIGVKKDDCDVHRFLWNVDGTTKVMRFARVPFGNCSSPFILNATVQFHLSGFPESRVVEELKENMYVDDFLSGADSVEECCTVVKDAIRIMSQASMPLVKWGSNSPEVAEILHRDFRDKYLDRESFKVLGLLWLASDDCFTFRGSVLAPDLCITERVVLSFFSKLFDPLGFAAQYVLQAKCLFQELWTLDLGWDDEVPPEYQIRFLRWMDGFDVLKSWRIPRRYTPGRWDAIRRHTLSLVCFYTVVRSWASCICPHHHASGKSKLVVVDGTVNQQCYIGFLRQTLLPGASATFQRNFALVHGNASPHTARNTRNILVGDEVEVMQWPTRNPIKHIWDQMGLFIRYIDNPPTTVVRLQEVLLQSWGAVNPEWMEVLVRSIPRRLRAVMAARGGHTWYQLEIKTQSTKLPSKSLVTLIHRPISHHPKYTLISKFLDLIIIMLFLVNHHCWYALIMTDCTGSLEIDRHRKIHFTKWNLAIFMSQRCHFISNCHVSLRKWKGNSIWSITSRFITSGCGTSFWCPCEDHTAHGSTPYATAKI